MNRGPLADEIVSLLKSAFLSPAPSPPSPRPRIKSGLRQQVASRETTDFSTRDSRELNVRESALYNFSLRKYSPENAVLFDTIFTRF